MATRTISTRLVLEGEAEYRAQLKNVNAELALQKSELEKVESQYRTSANSMEALTAKLLEMDRTVLLHKIQPLPDQQLGALQSLPGQILQNKVPHPMAQ